MVIWPRISYFTPVYAILLWWKILPTNKDGETWIYLGLYEEMGASFRSTYSHLAPLFHYDVSNLFLENTELKFPFLYNYRKKSRYQIWNIGLSRKLYFFFTLRQEKPGSLQKYFFMFMSSMASSKNINRLYMHRTIPSVAPVYLCINIHSALAPSETV
jgi:hypothetical protein